MRWTATLHREFGFSHGAGLSHSMRDRPQLVIKRNTRVEIVATIGSSLSFYTKLKTPKFFGRINRERFVLI
jgi:hypothetical protein